MATNLKKFTITDNNNTTHDVQVQSAIEDSAGNKISDTYTKKADLKVTQLGYTTREPVGKTIVTTFHPEASVDPTDGKNISFNRVAWSGNYDHLSNTPHLYEYTIKLYGGAVNGLNGRSWDCIVKCLSKEYVPVGEQEYDFDTKEEAWNYLFWDLGMSNQPMFFICYVGPTAGLQYKEWTGIARFANDYIRWGSASEGTDGYGMYVDLILMQGASGNNLGSEYIVIYPSLSVAAGLGTNWVLRYDSGDECYRLKFNVLDSRVVL